MCIAKRKPTEVLEALARDYDQAVLTAAQMQRLWVEQARELGTLGDPNTAEAVFNGWRTAPRGIVGSAAHG
jgi:hypothetical protein